MDINRVTVAESITVTEDDIISDDKLCEKGYNSFAEKCYLEVREKMNYTDAGNHCKSRGGGSLVYSRINYYRFSRIHLTFLVESGNELKHFVRMAKILNGDSWIGTRVEMWSVVNRCQLLTFLHFEILKF